jgi:murein DD-endopeptidase MepM/ murein hydrolase activator NlpD
MIYGPIKDNSVLRTKYNNELYTLYDKLDSQNDKNGKTVVAGTPH